MTYTDSKSSNPGTISFHKTLARILALGGLLAGATAFGANVNKDNNTDDLNLGTSWVGGLPPTSSDVALWDSTVAADNTTLLAANTNWAGVKILNPGGPVTINSTSTNANASASLTLGASGLNLSSASADLTFGAPVALLGANTQHWSVGPGRLLTLNGALVRAATGNSATVSIDTSLGGTINIASGTVSSLLLAGNAPFATVNVIDFAALDASRNVVPASTLGTIYGPYNAGNAGVSGTYPSPVLDVTGTTAGSAVAFRLGNSLTVPNGIRFEAANTQNTQWTVDTSSSGRLLSTGAILVGPDVGAQNVTFGGPGGVRANGNAQDLILFQNNPSGDLIFTTVINPASSSSASPLVKTGPGRVVLATVNTYTGPTRIEQGTLIVNGSTTANSAVTVNNGATLGGAGTILGSVTVASGAAVAPGSTNGQGTLTIGGSVTLNSASALNFYSPTTPTTNSTALLNLTNNLVVNGTVNVSILSGSAAIGQYPLVKWTNAIPGAVFSALNLAFLPPHVGGYLSNNTSTSSIDLVVTNITEPLTWSTGSGAWDINSSVNWKDSAGNPTTYQQTGALADTVVFEDTLSGASPIMVTLNTNVVPPGVTVNSTKNYTITGSGSIRGPGGLTKQGSGPLTLATVNSFTGSANLNGGTVVFSSSPNLGTGPINFGGGVLQYASGNSDDISPRIITFGAGGGTIDTGGNTVNFASPVGNNGTGGLTKIGNGTLTLNGTNRYSGNTLVTQGTLAISSLSYISNSVAIIVNSGATLDVTQNSPITLSTPVAQSLSGAGTISGSLALPASTTVSPGTNGVVGTFNVTGDVTFNGGTYVCDISAASRDLINITSGLQLTSGKLQLNVTGLLANGSYKIIQYGGSLLSGTGSSGNLTISGFSQSGKSATLSDAASGEIDLVIADTASDLITWSGNDGSTWDLTGTTNWLNGSNPWAYTNGDTVAFDDTGLNGFVTVQSAVRPNSVTVNNNALPYTLVDGTSTGAGKISGSATLTKNGSGTLVLDTLNDNSGLVTINSGTVQVGDGSNNGDIGTGNIVDNSALVFMQTSSRTVNGSISGTGTLTQQGTTTLILAQNNTYAGATTIASGTLQAGTGTGVGTIGPAPVTDNGTLSFNRSGTFTINNGISGTGSLNFSGTATATLAGVNSYHGTTTVASGTTLKLGSANVIPAFGAGSNNVNITGKLDLNGFSQTVSRLNGSGTLVNDTGTATNVFTINYDGAGTADSSVVIADNDGAGGKVALLKLGSGSQILRASSTFTGGTIVSNGTLNLRGAGSTVGSGPVILRGGNLSFAGVTFTNSIEVDTNATIDTPGNANVVLDGNITGSNNLTVFIDNNETFSWNGLPTQWAGFTGNVIITNGPGFFRFQASQGSAAATFDMTGSTVTLTSQNAGTFQLGALVGDSTPFLGSPNGSTFVIGGNNLSTTFGGTLNATSNNLIKVGTGTFTLSGSDGFTGFTTVSNGILALTGSTTLDSSSGIAVRNGGSLDVSGINGGILNIGNIANQTLSGSGTVLGSVTATGNAIATINPGDGIGTLTINNALTLAANSVLTMELNRTNSTATNDMISAGSITANGTLNVTNLGPNLVNGDTFKLFNAPVTGFATIILPAADSTGTNAYTWNTNLDVNGSIQLVSGGVSPINTTPTNIVFQATNGQLTLSWPADHTGWHLQMQTNGLASTSNWFNVPGAEGTNLVILPIGTTNRSVFFRMAYP
jgi:autotransporter-associated beta strand protein